MKKIITGSVFFLCLFLFHAPSAFSQEDSSSTKSSNNGDKDDDDSPQGSATNQKAHSNKATSRINFGLEAGLNISDFVYGQTDDGNDLATDAIIRARIGMVLDIHLHNCFYIQPGIFYVMNGATNNEEQNTWNVNTIEVPVNLIYKFGKPGNNHFFIGAGPYIGYNVSGTYNFNGSGKLNIGSDDNDNLKALDIGIGINGGYELKNGLFFRLRYQRGVTNMQPQTGSFNPTINTSSAGIQIGYFFGKCTKHANYTKHPGQSVWDQ